MEKCSRRSMYYMWIVRCYVVVEWRKVFTGKVHMSSSIHWYGQLQLSVYYPACVFCRFR